MNIFQNKVSRKIVLGGLNTYDIDFHLYNCFLQRFMQGKELSIPNWSIFSGKCCFLIFFGPSSLARNLSPNQATVETQMIPNIKITSKRVELVLQSSLSQRFLCINICIHWNWKTTSSLSTHLGKKSRDNKIEALLAIQEVKIS